MKFTTKMDTKFVKILLFDAVVVLAGPGAIDLGLAADSSSGTETN